MEFSGVSVVGFVWVFLAIMISLFMGSPDLHDAIIFYLASGNLDALNSLAAELD